MPAPSSAPAPDQPMARFGGRLATGLCEVTSDPAALESEGWWAVAHDFEGRLTCARFADVRPDPAPGASPAPGTARSPAAGTARWTAPATPPASAGSVSGSRPVRSTRRTSAG